MDRLSSRRIARERTVHLIPSWLTQWNRVSTDSQKESHIVRCLFRTTWWWSRLLYEGALGEGSFAAVSAARQKVHFLLFTGRKRATAACQWPDRCRCVATGIYRPSQLVSMLRGNWALGGAIRQALDPGPRRARWGGGGALCGGVWRCAAGRTAVCLTAKKRHARCSALYTYCCTPIAL